MLSTLIRSHYQKSADRWREEILAILLGAVIPSGMPYLLDCAFSFLQLDPLDLSDPIRVDLYLPDLPLFIDLLPPGYSSDYREARKYLSRSDWEEMQRRLAWKETRLKKYRVPYLRIYSQDSSYPLVLSRRIQEITGATLPFPQP